MMCKTGGLYTYLSRKINYYDIPIRVEKNNSDHITFDVLMDLFDLKCQRII